jgi:hypothetical protein
MPSKKQLLSYHERKRAREELDLVPGYIPDKHKPALKMYPPEFIQPDDVKPYWLCLGAFLPYAMFSSLLNQMADVPDFEPKYFEGCFLLAYMALTFYLRIKDAGHPARFYEILWGCNMAIMQCGIGCITGQPSLISSALAIVGLDQCIWYVECTIWLFTRKFPLGVASYITWPEVGLVRKITTMHHLWFLPFGFYCLRGAHYHEHAWLHGSSLATLLVLLARLVTPCYSWLPMTPEKKAIFEAHEAHKPGLSADGKWYLEYLNINLAFVFWVSIKIPLFHLCDEYPAFIYVPYMSLVMSACNYLPSLLMRFISTLVFGQ